MSKILAVVAEYNPLHNGHLYHFRKSKRLIKPDYTVCILSGNFCERGNTSIIDKWKKTETALKCGFDMVIELPVYYSISSAENYAEGVIKILDGFVGNDVVLSFGSECGKIDVLDEIADVLYEEPEEYQTILNHELSKGLSFPKARENALMLYLNDVRKFSNIMSNPNNILAVEYLKAIKKLNSNVQPYTIQRIDEGYNSLKTKDDLASATAIRSSINNNLDFKKFVPPYTYKVILDAIEQGKLISDISVFEKEILYTLRRMSTEEISELQDVTEGLENLIKQAANNCNNIDDLIFQIKSKRYTRSRIQRILLYSLLNITKKDIQNSHKVKPYIRVLGVSEYGKDILSELSDSRIKQPIVTSVKDFFEKTNNRTLHKMMLKDILATNIYTLGYKYDSKSNLDYTEKLIVE